MNLAIAAMMSLQSAKEAPRPDLMPAPGSALAQIFTGADITKFLEWFNLSADMAHLPESMKLKTVIMYCHESIRDEVTIILGLGFTDWKTAQETLMEEYRFQDSTLARTSAQYLEALAAQTYTDHHNICRFLHTFTYLSTKAVEKDNIVLNRVKELLLQNCDKQYAEKILWTLRS